MSGNEDQRLHIRNDVGRNLTHLQNVCSPSGALRLVIVSLRIVDHVMTPQRHLHFVLTLSEMSRLIELDEAVQNMIEVVVGPLRLPVELNKFIEDGFRQREGAQTPP